MKLDKLALICAVLIGALLGAEDKKPTSTTTLALTAETKAAIAIANTRLLNARLRESERKQAIQVAAQQQIEQEAQMRRTAEQEYQVTLGGILKPLGFEGCTVTPDAELGECPPKDPKVQAKK